MGCCSLLMRKQQGGWGDRAAIVRGFWGCQGSAWGGLRVRTSGPVACVCGSNAAGSGIPVANAADGSVTSGRPGIGTRDDLPLGGASGEARVLPAACAVSSPRRSHRARRIRRPKGARHPKVAAADQRGLSVDADQPRGGAARRELGQSAARRESLFAEWDRTRKIRQPRHIGLDEISAWEGSAVLDRAI